MFGTILLGEKYYIDIDTVSEKRELDVDVGVSLLFRLRKSLKRIIIIVQNLFLFKFKCFLYKNFISSIAVVFLYSVGKYIAL